MSINLDIISMSFFLDAPSKKITMLYLFFFLKNLKIFSDRNAGPFMIFNSLQNSFLNFLYLLPQTIIFFGIT